MIAPYKYPAVRNGGNRRFNYLHSNVRIDIEHSFGILKQRFPSLRNIRLRLKNKEDYMRILQWIMTCFVLHNFLQTENDEIDRDEIQSTPASRQQTLNTPVGDTHTQLRETIKARVLSR